MEKDATCWNRVYFESNIYLLCLLYMEKVSCTGKLLLKSFMVSIIGTVWLFEVFSTCHCLYIIL